MKQQIKELLTSIINELQSTEKLPKELSFEVQVENARDKSHGDFASNIALMLAKPAKMKPRDLAEMILEAIPESPWLKAVSIAGPGFINFTLAENAVTEIIPQVLSAADGFGYSNKYAGQKINVEFISANPTGPLHVGHGRGAAYGATISDLFAAVGYEVEREYYVNDAGRQMNILAASIWLRYLELLGESFAFPKNGYKGSYVIDMAKALQEQYADKFLHSADVVFQGVPADETEDGEGDKEAHIDGLINNAKTLLGADYDIVFNMGLNTVLDDIKDDCEAFGIKFQNWFSEKSLESSGAIQHAIDSLKEKDYLYTKDNAIWFKSSELGDDKDRVVVRENGQTTYFASDLAYLLNKVERGYDKIIYLFGADHHGYVPRLRAAAKALGVDDTKLMIPLVQFAILYRGKEKVQMSTRSGEFVTLRQLRDEVGKDACRYFYVMRKVEQHMDFDLDLAKSNTKDNPVFYIQYAHARICRVFSRAEENDFAAIKSQGLQHLDLLTHETEKELMVQLAKFPEIVLKAAEQYEPHILANYLKDLATVLHSYYDASGEKILVEDAKLRHARLCLLKAVKQVLVNGLKLLGLSAPEKM